MIDLISDVFFLAARDEAQRSDKRTFYAWMYGNYKAELDMLDFLLTYCMGREL